MVHPSILVYRYNPFFLGLPHLSIELYHLKISLLSFHSFHILKKSDAYKTVHIQTTFGNAKENTTVESKAIILVLLPTWSKFVGFKLPSLKIPIQANFFTILQAYSRD